MTVQNTIVKNVYQGNGSTTVFPYTFALNDDDGEYVQVYVTDSSGTESQTTNFTVDTDAKTVTYPATGTALPSGCVIALLRAIPDVQELNLESQGAFFAEDIEAELDRIVMMVQQVSETAGRCIKAGPTSSLSLDATTIEEIYAGRDAAVAAASAASVSRTDAAASKTAAAASATAAAESATAAATSAANAAASATTAGTKATAAATSASNAAVNATAAQASATTAASKAQDATDQAAMANTAASGAEAWAKLANDYTEPLRNALEKSMFEYDTNADLMPVANPLAAVSDLWTTDDNGDIEPAA